MPAARDSETLASREFSPMDDRTEKIESTFSTGEFAATVTLSTVTLNPYRVGVEYSQRLTLAIIRLLIGSRNLG